MNPGSPRSAQNRRFFLSALTLASALWSVPGARAEAPPPFPDTQTAVQASTPWVEPAPLPPTQAEIMPVEAVKPGQRVVGYTVFQGSKVEPITGVVQGLARNYLGPGRHVVLVRFDGERMAHVGIVHGMSGSPLFIDGKLLGALSLAMGPMPKDPIGGVTPFVYMQDEGRTWDDLAPYPGRGGVSIGGSGVDQDPGGFRGPGLQPLRATLQVRGLDASLLELLRQALGNPPVEVLGGAAGGMATEGHPAEEVRAAAASLLPGSSVAAMLVDGDTSLSATGTVTWRAGETVYAFGHPFLQEGAVAFPMATAEVVATIADHTYPYKLANAGVAVGTISFDRPTAIVGRVGQLPPLIPLEVELKQNGRPAGSFRYRLVDERSLTPVLVELMVSNSIKKQWRTREEARWRLLTQITLGDGRVLRREGLFGLANLPGAGSIFDLVKEVTEPFTQIYLNPFEKVTIQRIQVSLDAAEDVKLFTVDDVYLERSRVYPGTSLQVQVAARQVRGAVQLKPVTVPIPTGLPPGELILRVADWRTVEQTNQVGGRMSSDKAESLSQLLELLTRRRTADRCYVQLLRRTPTLVVQHLELPQLPGSTSEVLRPTVTSIEPAVLDRTLLWEGELAFEGQISGAHELTLQVLPGK